MRGFLKYIDENNQIFYVKRNDPIIKEKNLIWALKKYVTAKDINGKTYVVFNNDLRLKNGELFPATAKYFINCKIHRRQKIDDHRRMKEARMPEEYKNLCPKCKEFYLSESYIPSEEDKINCINALNSIHFCSSNQYVPKYFKKYMPQFFKIIDNFNIESLSDLKFSIKLYLLKNKIFKIPICNLKGCSNKCELLKPPGFGFTLYCKDHKNVMFSSKKEIEVYEFIKENYTGKIEKNYRKFKNSELDIYIPELNLGIEFNGLYWHSEKNLEKSHHYDKFIFFKNIGVKLITVWEDDWNFKQDIIKSILCNAINNNHQKIDARKCEIKELNNLEKTIFLNNNHIQGNCTSSINLGLFFNNELVSVMTFGKTRFILGQKSRENEYELLRFCSKLYCSVRGAASKLFKYFIDNHNPNKIISYANLDISSGNMYNILGFKDMGNTKINYWWSDGKNRFHRSGFMKHKLVKDGANPNKTEAEIMNEKGYIRIWGIGNNKWIWNKTLKD
jgi:hypothetical protein